MKTMDYKWKWISIGTASSIFMLSHIGMIGMISRQSKFPVVNVPVGSYTSYKVEANKDGYRIDYRANDPKMSHVERDIKKKAGFLGLGNNTITERKSYPATSLGTKNLVNESTKGGKSEECIEAIGAGKGTGRMVGASVGAAVAPSLTGIPFVGWVLAGAATMMGMDAGSDVGGTMIESINPNCEEEL
jgi:hypothetical protein|tara:strand:- start:2792 stop:3355 length:564 start_codon:yes stop_codon:yes gene_type:complete